MSLSPRLKAFLRREKTALEKLTARRNRPLADRSGVFTRWQNPVLTAAHIPCEWRVDLDEKRNPRFLERLGVNAVFNAGAIYLNGRFLLVARVEGKDRKSFFAVAESRQGASGFRFWDEPVVMPEAGDPAVNVYDMRLTAHEDGWIYGLFCVERKDPKAPPGDLSSALASCGIARTRDLKKWERLPDLVTSSPQQRNVVLHPEYVNGKYALYTRPQDDFIEAGTGGGIAFGLTPSMEKAVVPEERIVDPREYHTIKESKNGQGPTPIRTPKGWLHITHGVRATAAGLRYVLYALMTDLKEPRKVLHRPGGYLLAPEGEERVGDVSNVLFSNGLIVHKDVVYLYYASSDTRMHVATAPLGDLVDWVMNTPEDPLFTGRCVEQRLEMIRRNRKIINPA